jgi:tetratricopeptide (TPR) repeat protein
MIRRCCRTLAFSLLVACSASRQMPAQQSAAELLIQRARMLDAQGRHDLAAENWRQLLLIQPREPEGLLALVRYYQSTGDQVHAQQYGKLLREVQPRAAATSGAEIPTRESSDELLRQAAHLSATHDYAAALTMYQRAFSGSQPPDSWAVAYYETEAAIPSRQAHAVLSLRALSQKYPANPSYQLALGRILTYRPATRLEGVVMLSQVQGSSAQNEEARTAWRQAILWDLNAPAARETARKYLSRYPDTEMATRLVAASEKPVTSKQSSPLEGEGYKALAASDFSVAEDRFTALASEAGHAGQGDVGLGFVSMKKKDFAEAVDHFEHARAAGVKSSALDKALRDARYWSAMSVGNAALAANDTEKASAEFERARTLNGAAPEAQEALGGTLLADKQAQQALTVFADDLKSNPHRADAWVGWMSAALDAGRAQDVLARQKSMPADVRTALTSRPDYLALLASAELAIGDQSSATRLISRLDKTAEGTSPQNASALVRAAGLLLAHGYADRASRLCVSAIKADHGNADAWQTLVEAEHAAGRDDSAVQVALKMPSDVDIAAMKNADFLVALAAVYQAQQGFRTASSLLAHAAALDGVSARTATSVTMQMASLAMSQGDKHKAYLLYQDVERQTPENADAWIGMVNALHEGKQDAEALGMIETLPSAVTSRLRGDPAFLQTAAFVYSENGKSREAMLCLSAVTRYYVQQHKAVPFSVDTEYAWLLLNAGRDAELVSVLDRLGKTPHLTADQSSSVTQIWITWSVRRAEAAYKAGDAKRAVAILQAADQAFPRQTTAHIALANMYVRTGSANAAYRIFLQMDWQGASVEQYQAAIDCALAAHNISHAEFWLKLGLEQHPDDPALLRAGARVEEQKGNLKQAMRYLTAVRDNGPLNEPDSGSLKPQIHASSHVSGDAAEVAATSADRSPQDALIRLLGGGPVRNFGSSQDSFAGSILSTQAAASRDGQPMIQRLSFESANDAGRDHPVRETLPSSTRAVATGWGSEAPSANAIPAAGDTLDELFKPSVSVKGKEVAPTADPLAGLDLDQSTQRAQSMMAPKFPEASVAPPSDDNLDAILRGSSPHSSSFAESLDGPAAASAGIDPVRTSSSLSAILGSGPKLDSTQQQASTELAELESRYSPWLATGASVREHSGTLGFDHLLEYDAEIEGSSVLAGSARFTVMSRPVQLQSGTPDPASNYRFGTGSTAPTVPQFASGLGLEAQFATRSVQASIGTSPSSFLVPNAVGTLSIRPAQGPFTLRLYRNNVKDTMLSYAGMKDPATGQIWGGVVATGAALELNRGAAESGFYATIAGEKLTGRNVADNTRFFGNAGAYWQAYTNAWGTLKLGANITAMHYALNERFFTFGQGGYFSPTGFLTINAPITWESHPMYGTYYTMTGSLGAQNIQQGQARPGSLVIGDGIEASTGASYDLHGRVVRRLTEHWNIEAFLDMNNARQYTDRAAGFSVRYLKFPQPAELPPTGFLGQAPIRPLQQP